MGGAGRPGARAGGVIYYRTILYYRRVTVYQWVLGPGHIERARAGHRRYSQEQRSAAADYPENCLKMQWIYNQVDSWSRMGDWQAS